MRKIALIGAGSWGTAIAHLLGAKGKSVSMWAHSESTAQAINATHKNPKYLTDVELENVYATSSYEEALADAEALIMVCPSSYLRQTATESAAYVSSRLPVIVLSKGIEERTGNTMVDVLEDVLGHAERLACLSGPNHAEEVSRNLPAATVVASSNSECADYFQKLFSAPAFRVYTSDDVVGVEICAASKNIIAIANGMSCAMDLGDNASASLMTRGLAEVTRLVVALGGDSRTCLGLAGVGDLIATCSSVHSRNRALGELLVAGGTLEQFERQTHMVAEGAVACKTVTELSDRIGVEMPIAQAVRRVLWEGLDPRSIVDEFFDRPQKAEVD